MISEKEIDTALGRVLAARFRLGLFDPPDKVPYAQIPISENDSPEHQALALKVAEESIVLLKNDGLLPLDRAKIKRIAVIGANAPSVDMLLGNYNGTPSRSGHDSRRNQKRRRPERRSRLCAGLPARPGTGRLQQTGRSKCSPTPSPPRNRRTSSFTSAASTRNSKARKSRANGFDGFLGGDRTKIELPSVQEDLLKALRATGKPVVFVNCSGSAIAMPWEAANLPAILQAWYPGEQGGRAVAEVLFGDVNPAGRLPVTFYASTADLPPFEDYSMSNRTYRYFNGQPEFAFGHGLSYTKFDYAAATLDKSQYTAADTAKISFLLKNSGARDGDEVAQVYFRHLNSAQQQPKLALCGFTRIHLAQGQGARITVDIPMERFRYWDTAKKQYVVEPGDYELLVGAASDDIRLRAPLKIAAAQRRSDWFVGN